MIPLRVRTRMERLFGCELSDVRIIDSDAPERIGARAFAFGSSIFVPHCIGLFESADGWWLLGHELTHVLQQREGRARSPDTTDLRVLDDPVLEQEADRMGALAARAFESGRCERGGYAARPVRTGQRTRPVIQCVMTLDEFKAATPTSGIRSLDKIGKVDAALKALHALNARKPKSYTDLTRAAKALHQAATTFKNQKPESSRLAGVDRLLREIAIEDAILSRLAQFEATADEVEKFAILEQVQENFFKQMLKSELNNPGIANEITNLRIGLVNNAANQGEAIVRRDIEQLIAIGKDPGTPALLRSVIAECTAARNVVQVNPANSNPGLKYNTSRGATRKYTLNHSMLQDLGKRFRMGSLLHELTHLSIAEIFDNTCVMLAVSKTATDAEILSLARSRNGKILQLIAQIEANLPEFERLTPLTIQTEENGPMRNRLYVEFKEKATYPVSGKFSDQYLVKFKRYMDPDLHARLVNLAAQGLDCELVEYDTVINQMLLWAHQHGMSKTCSVYTALEGMVQEAHAYRMRSRALNSRPPAKPLPIPPPKPLPRRPWVRGQI